MSKMFTAETMDELHHAVEAREIRIAIFVVGYWGAFLFGVNEAAELWPEYVGKVPFWAACLAFLSLAWNCYRDYEDWRSLSLLEKRLDKRKQSHKASASSGVMLVGMAEIS